MPRLLHVTPVVPRCEPPFSVSFDHASARHNLSHMNEALMVSETWPSLSPKALGNSLSARDMISHRMLPYLVLTAAILKYKLLAACCILFTS